MPQYFGNMSDREILVSVATDVSWVKDAITSLTRTQTEQARWIESEASKIVVLQEDMRRREMEATSTRNRAYVGSGVITAIVVAVLTAIKQIFGTN